MELTNGATSTLISRLIAFREAILECWNHRARREIPELAVLDEPDILGELPRVLDAISLTLEHGDLAEDLAATATSHVRLRSRVSQYTGRTLLREFQLLRVAVFETLEATSPVAPRERDAILRVLDVAASEASAELAELVLSPGDTSANREMGFRTLANALPVIVWTATADFHVDWYNDWWFRYLGLPRGTRWDDPETAPMHPEDVERTRPRLRESVETGKDFLMEQRFRRGSDGQYRWHLVRGVPLRDEHGRIYKWVGANTDIHDLKAFASQLEEERQLREQFIATLSHDLRTPLTTAKLNASMVSRKVGDPEALYKLAARVIDNLDRTDQMISDLLDVTRVRAGQPLPLDIARHELTAIARQTLEELSLVHGDRFVLVNGGELWGFWSASAVRRVLENLCNNAIKYGASDTPVTVKVLGTTDQVTISVHNEGNPISPEDQCALFRPFRRGRAARTALQQGWGLGLTLVDGLARAHRGSVQVDSSEETGTTFTVVLARDARQAH